MATSRKTSAPAAKRGQPATDSRGNVRVYADIPDEIAQKLAIRAITARMAKKDLLAQIIADALA